MRVRQVTRQDTRGPAHRALSAPGVRAEWALQTVTTVGYGDVTPSHVAGRLVGAAVMLEGTAFIAVVTAVTTSTFVARATHEYEAARMKDELTDRDLMEKSFDEPEQKLDELAAMRAPGD